MKTIKCWKLEAISGAEGEHRSLMARFDSMEEAEKARPECGGYGGRVFPETITIFNTAIEWKPRVFDEASKVSGLAKLTDAEKTALGLEQ